MSDHHTGPPLAVRSGLRLLADPRRVLARLHVPGHELLADSPSRATGVLGRILAIGDDEVAVELDRVLRRYAGRHRDLAATHERHAAQIAHRLPAGPELSPARRRLLGAYFTHEFSIEGAALFNPSLAPHPDQSGLAAGECRFVMTLRAVGEGHISCVELRSGVLDQAGDVRLDDPGPFVESGVVGPTSMNLSLFASMMAEAAADEESTRFVLSRLGATFTDAELEAALAELEGQRLTRSGGDRTAQTARHLARCSYQVEFDGASGVAERVLSPVAPSETAGIEDVRLVRFTGDDAAVRYLGTYTAYDGRQIAPQLLETVDFRTFRMSQLSGQAATNKGMALFPRTVGGRHLALSRWDRENCSLAVSDDGMHWPTATTVHRPERGWELIQTGNCGSPMETEAGWLVLTHGVGPMREYAIGALLLDLDDPTRVVGDLGEPLLTADTDEREGYVPNVVYSCGGMIHGDVLVLPYGASDDSVRCATVDVPSLLERLTGG